MSENELKRLLNEIENLKSYYYALRSFFPYMNNKLINQSEITTGLFYSMKGFQVSFKFTPPLNEKSIIQMNHIGHYINQNFIVRLYAMLESYKMTPETEQEYKIVNAVNIIRRLRNIFAHTSGKYEPTDMEYKQKETMSMLVAYCPKLVQKDPEKYNDWPLAIDEVIEPLFNGCIEYIKDKR